MNPTVQPAPPVVTPPAPVLFPTRQTLVTDVKKELSTIEKSWRSPALWFHLAVQIATWTGYFSSTTNSVRFGTLTLSGAALIAYLTHLASVSK
jgi:hypothetical protein